MEYKVATLEIPYAREGYHITRSIPDGRIVSVIETTYQENNVLVVAVVEFPDRKR